MVKPRYHGIIRNDLETALGAAPRVRRRVFPLLVGLAVLLPIAWFASRQLDGPWGMVPGGPFVGPSMPCGAAGWERFAETEELELEVRAEKPRSLTTWSVVHEGGLYVPADFLTPWKYWPHQVLADERIRVRFEGQGGEIFACRAERVVDEGEIEALRQAIAAKYDLDPDGREARIEVWWFRVRPR